MNRLCVILAGMTIALAAVYATDPVNLAKNARFTEAIPKADGPSHFTLNGDVAWTDGPRNEFAPKGVAFRSGKDINGDDRREGFVSQDVTGIDAKQHRGYRFTFRGLPEKNFAVTDDGLYMKVGFFSKNGTNPLDGVSRKLYPLIERDRKELAANGNGYKNGASVWKTYSLEFKLPFPEIDTLNLAVGFRNGSATTYTEAAFLVTDFSLVPIADSNEQPKLVAGKPAVVPDDLKPLGGKWHYRPAKADPAELLFTAENADRLFYRDVRLTNPFSENMSAWLRQGYMDVRGNVVTEDRFVADSVTVRFVDGKTMVVRAKNLPNHPTAKFPGLNPSYIQELDATYYLPLEPKRNPNAVSLTANNSNNALPMGPIGVAVNGVVFFNPFDAGMQDAHNIMDRCCGHPSPNNMYHYHKYPVCVKSPFVDEPELLRMLAQALREEGYAVDEAETGTDGLFKAATWDYDAILLDIMLPGLDGWQLLSQLRTTKRTPVIMLTARDAINDRVRGLDTGADDYVVKPFALGEVLARVRSLIRRSAGLAASSIVIADVSIDTAKRLVSQAGQPVVLTAREYAILELLAIRRGELVTKSQIYDHIFDENDDSLSNLVEVHVSNIRKKLGKDFIATRRGMGYVIDG